MLPLSSIYRLQNLCRLQNVCRLQNMCTLRSVVSRETYFRSQTGPYKNSAAQCAPQWTKYVDALCFSSQQNVGPRILRPVRSFSTDAEPKLVHILDSNNELVEKMTIKKAQIMAHKKGMKLFHVRKQNPQEYVDEYKLLSEADFKKAAVKDQEDQSHRKKFKEFKIGVNIHEADLKMKLKLMKKNLLKGLRVKLTLSPQAYFSGKVQRRQQPIEGKMKANADEVIAACLEELNDVARVTSVVKGTWVYTYEFEAFDNIKNP